jgi:hypothetical protein
MAFELMKLVSTRDILNLGMTCRGGRDIADDHRIWVEVARVLSLPEPATVQDRAAIKRRVMLLERSLPMRRGYSSAEKQIRAWRALGADEVRVIPIWTRLTFQQQTARLLVATPEAAVAIVGSGHFTPSEPLLQAAIDRGARFGEGMVWLVINGFGRAWDGETAALILDHLEDGQAPDSRQLVAAVRGDHAELVDLLWNRGVRPNEAHRTEIRTVGGPIARQIAARLGVELSVTGSRPPSSPEGSSDGEPSLKNGRHAGTD